MPPPPEPVGRRERNKQDKLDRITAAASALFATRGVDDVTTQEIADAADIGTGTLFLYVKTKGELLLLVQNAHYERALEDGLRSAESHVDGLNAVMALLRPIVECNRAQVDNGRTYLREMVFGDHADPQRAVALGIVARTEVALTNIIARDRGVTGAHSATLAHVISAVMFVEMSTSPVETSVDALVSTIRDHVHAVLAR